MKRILLLSGILLSSLCAVAQMHVHFNLNHTLSGSAFALNQTDQNNLNQNFEFTRVQYYINGITLVHDGGQETILSDSSIFYVDASQSFSEDLGMFSITALEGIKFHVGVNSTFNHIEPSLWSAGHPLSPKQDIMWWGWSSGYRFAAIEGKAGSSLATTFQIHALEDWNYFETSITFATPKTGSQVDLTLDADYTRALESLNVAAGIIEHGGANESITLLENFRDYVFTESAWPTSVAEIDETQFKLFPNPSTGLVHIDLEQEARTLILRSSNGQLLSKMPLLSKQVSLNIETPGLYFLEIQTMNGGSILKKLVIR